MVLLSLTVIVLTLLLAPGDTTLKPAPMDMRIINALVSYLGYIGKMIWPSNLAIFYPSPETIPVWKVAGSGLILSGITLFSIRTIRQRPYLFIGWLWYLGTLLPSIGIVRSGLWPAAADRFAYVPLIGLFVMLSWGGKELAAAGRFRKRLVQVSACGFLAAMIVVTYLQAGHWEDRVTLFSHTLMVTENNPMAHNNLAIAMMEQGKANLALHHFSEIFKITPKDPDNLYNLGKAFQNAGEFDKAVYYYEVALDVRPENEKVHNNLGNLYFFTRDFEKACFHYSEALGIRPNFSDAHNNLANVLYEQGKIEGAIRHYHEALKINSENRNAHYNLGNLFLGQKRYKEAATHFAESIRIDPSYARAYKKIGALLIRQGKHIKAEVFFSKAAELDTDAGGLHGRSQDLKPETEADSSTE